MRIRESEEKGHIVDLLYRANFRYYQDALSDRAFDYNFDDGVLYQDYSSGFNPEREIARMVKADNEGQHNENPNGLAAYADELTDLIVDMNLSFDADGDELLVTTEFKPGVELSDKITMNADSKYAKEKTILEALKDYVRGQLSDGWGEGFEQQEVASKTIYAVYNEDDDTDCEFFADYRGAEREVDERNEGAYGEDEEEDMPTYEYCEVPVTVYCSFWDRDHDTFIKALIDGRDEGGFDRKGFDKDGYNRSGRDKDGYDREGYNYSGRDREGFDKEGYDKNGRDREGFDKSGVKPLGIKRPTDKSGREQGAIFNMDRSGRVTIANTFDMGESRKKPNKKTLKEALICSPVGSFTHSVSGSQNIMGYKGLQESEETGNFVLITDNTALNQAEEITGLSPILSECSEDVIGNYLEVSIDEAEQFNDVGFAIYSYDDIIQEEGKIIEIVDERVFLEDPVSYKNNAM